MHSVGAMLGFVMLDMLKLVSFQEGIWVKILSLNVASLYIFHFRGYIQDGLHP